MQTNFYLNQGKEAWSCSQSSFVNSQPPSFFIDFDLVPGEEVENTDDLCPPFMMVIKLLGCFVAVDGEEDTDSDKFVDGFRTIFLIIAKNISNWIVL